MLVIISDLHLSDGTTGATISAGAFDILSERLGALATTASWRAGGAYRPIEAIDLVLLGDVLDPIRSARWLARPGVRPWGNPHAPEFVDLVGRITSDILANNEHALGVLRGLASGGAVSVPENEREGRNDRLETRRTGDRLETCPTADRLETCPTGRRPVPVRIHYMVGNHDWFYHLPGAGFDALRQTIVVRMGLANRCDAPFPHDSGESDELMDVMRCHRVCARHGDVYDPLNFEGDRGFSSLGDAIVIELVGRFAAEVAAELRDELPAATLYGLREIDNIRPLLLIPVWIDGLLERTCTPPLRKRVKAVWDRLVDNFLALEFVRRHERGKAADLVRGLERLLKFSKRLPLGWASAVAEWLSKLRGAETASYSPHALREPDFRNRAAQHIVYGHTHAAESVPLEAGYAAGCSLDQVYFNSGTWRRMYSQTAVAARGHEFIASDVTTYLAFFQDDERGGRPYETWSGTLGHAAPEITIHRIDQGRAHHVAGTIPAPGVPQHAPHITALPGQSARLPAGRL